MVSVEIEDRVAGAIMGALVGNALGVGSRWYYELEDLHRDHGDWISEYTTPKQNHYHSGLKAGQLSQEGLIFVMLLRSIVANNDYIEGDFTRRIDEELFPLMDENRLNAPGGYSNQSIYEVYLQRIKQKKTWKETGGNSITTEAAERCIVLACFYAKDVNKVAQSVSSNCRLTQNDEAVVSMTTAYNIILSRLIIGETLNSESLKKTFMLYKSGELPYVIPRFNNLSGIQVDDQELLRTSRYTLLDALLTPHFIAKAVRDEGIKIEPASRAALLYGMTCAIYHQLPAAYYLAIRYANDYELAVLHAINGGGENKSRAMLTGALVGAQVGLSGIPDRFIKGLENSEELLDLAKKLGKLVKSN